MASPTAERSASVRRRIDRLVGRDDVLRGTTALTLGLVLVLVALGGAVRATDSGLACPDWPFCYGKIVPRQADIPANSGYTLWNVWLEHSHRLVASLVGLLIVVLALWVWRSGRPRMVRWVVLAALVAVVVQGLLGALVVLHLLQGELVTAHLGTSMVVVACLVVAVDALARPEVVARRPSTGALALAGLVFVQLLVGSQVTGHHAGLAYGLDPLRFHGKLLPTSVADAAEAYHLTHRLLAYTVAIAACAFAVAVWRRRRRMDAASAVRTWSRATVLPIVLVALVLIQIALGMANIWNLTPPAVVTAHLAVASWIWATVVALALSPHLPDAPDASGRG